MEKSQSGETTRNRRDFLKSAGAAGLTTSLFTGRLRGANDRVAVRLSEWAQWAAAISATR
jgi:hypothetical protein